MQQALMITRWVMIKVCASRPVILKDISTSVIRPANKLVCFGEFQGYPRALIQMADKAYASPHHFHLDFHQV
jgi:hypothetical protein